MKIWTWDKKFFLEIKRWTTNYKKKKKKKKAYLLEIKRLTTNLMCATVHILKIYEIIHKILLPLNFSEFDE